MRINYRLFPKMMTIAAVAVLAAVTMTTTSFAQINADTANTLKVSPVRTDISADPGETRTVKITVTNPSNIEISARPVQNDFIAGDERGTPALILDETEYAKNHSLKRFMKPLENIKIPAKSSVIVEAVIEIPTNAAPGGYFGALRFAPVTPDTGGQVNLSASVASIILLQVRGDVAETLTLTDFAIQQNGATNAFFNEGKNISAMVRFQNDGGVQLGPIGKVSVTKGKEIVYDADFNNSVPRDMILPDSARRWDVPLQNIDGFGHYTVTAVFTYGSKNQSVEVTKTFWVIPVWVIVGAGVALLVIVAGVILLIARLRNGPKMRGPSKKGLRRR